MFVLTRKEAFRTAWDLFWLATGTRRVGVSVTPTSLVMVGDALIQEVK